MKKETIAMVTELSSELERLYLRYKRLPEVIDEEESAIRSHDLRYLEQIVEQKKDLISQIETQFAKIQHFAHSFKECEIKSLTDWLSYFESLKNSASKKDLLFKEYSRVVEQFKQTMTSLLNAASVIKPKIERNKTIADRLLNYYRESLNFWVELVQERASLYGARGKKESFETTIQLSVKA